MEDDRRKWLLSSAAARKKAEKESKLYYETARFVCDFYLPETEEEHKVLDVVSSNIIDIYRNYEKVFVSKKHNEDDVSEVIKEYRSKVENELNYFLENMINVATKQAIKDFIVHFKQGDVNNRKQSEHNGVGVDGDINNRTGIGRRNNKDKNKNKNKKKKKKQKQKQKQKAKQLTQLKLQQQKDEKLKQEADHYLDTIMFMHSFAHNKETTAQERTTLYRAYANVFCVYTDFYIRTNNKDECRNISSIIKEHRSKVEEELTYVCNNVSDVTIKQAFSQLLADFQSGPKPKHPPSQIHHPHLQDKDGNIMSSKPNMSSGEGSCKPLPICDDQLYYHDHEKCCPSFVDDSKLIYEVIEWIESERTLHYIFCFCYSYQDDECPDLTFADVESEDYECPDLTFADVESEDDECPDLTFADVEFEE